MGLGWVEGRRWSGRRVGSCKWEVIGLVGRSQQKKCQKEEGSIMLYYPGKGKVCIFRQENEDR